MTRGTKGSIREAVGEEDIESDKENELAEDDGDDYWATILGPYLTEAQIINQLITTSQSPL